MWRIDNANNFDLTPDRFEPNDTRGTSTVLGSLEQVTERDLTIHNQTDVDFYQYTADHTGKLIVNVYFNGLQGDLDLRVRDARGNVIASGLQSNVTPGRDRETFVIPVVSQQRYFIEVYRGAQHTNTYDLEVENFAAPVPAAVVLDQADDTGMSNLDNVTFDTSPRILVQADLADFAAMGIPILTAAQAAANNTPGAAVEGFRNGVSRGFATAVGGSAVQFDFTAALALGQGQNFLTAAVRMHVRRPTERRRQPRPGLRPHAAVRAAVAGAGHRRPRRPERAGPARLQ